MENNENYLKLPKKNYNEILFNKIINLIDDKFIKMNIIHKKILVKYLFRVVLLIYFYFNNENFIEQLYLNNHQDIFSLLVLMMPFYELNNSNQITSLDELFLNANSKSKSLSSSYYIDHLNLKLNSNYLEDYFNSIISSLSYTLLNVHCCILPNWINIFPYTMETYKNSNIYKNFKYLYETKKFTLQADEIFMIHSQIEKINVMVNTSHFLLGYPILYGTIYNFLYHDIKPIKWMIYDININDKNTNIKKIIPNIIYFANSLEITTIANKPWNKLNDDEKENKNKLWENFYKSSKTNTNSIKSIIMFYLRWEKDNDNLDQINISKKCNIQIKTNLENVLEENNIIIEKSIVDDKNENDLYNSKELENCLKEIYPNIKFENIYNYVYESIQRFRYTWYGYICMDESKNILDENNFYLKYFKNDVHIKIDDNSNEKYYYYVTPKNIYNYTKSIIHKLSNNNEYTLLSMTCKWNNISYDCKEQFINRLNGYYINEWFNITKNIKRTYGNINNNIIVKIMDEYTRILFDSDLYVNVIFQTLVYNGMFTYFKYNPKLTDLTKIPNKNTNYSEWNKYILNNININLYQDSYHQFSNTLLRSYGEKTIESIKNSKWYTNFGADWIAQIQLYHHYLNNRVMYITGATGAGKSTVAPFLLVYAVKMINFNNNAKVVCTQPRIQPAEDNAEFISKSIGIPITIKKNIDNILEPSIQQDINYIQYKHGSDSLIDDLYHPCLRLYTDGALYNIIKKNYIFKKSIVSYINPELVFISSNIFDIILVDEAHEHNKNMDMILTLSKYATYINNQVMLGIISATMDDDEIIYRKYYEPIDDNWRAPLDLDYIVKESWSTNRYYIDRRIHLSIPFGGMNFDVKEYPNLTNKYPESVGTFTDMKKINLKVIEILQHILSTSQKGDILIFQPGESDIIKLVSQINNIIQQTNVIAIPFYSKLKLLDNEIFENIVKKIQNKDVRNKIRYPKNKYEITDMFNIPQKDLLPEGTYNRFIIIATNIAEASITIDTLEYVIDTGNQKINVYDPNTNQEYLKIKEIAVPNQKQRKGRVGRKQPGSVYYTYDRLKLGEKVIYKINIENINSIILDLITLSNKQPITSINDPYNTNTFDNIEKYIVNQYIYLNNDSIKTLYDNYYRKKNISNIIYPYADGKYKLETLEDEKGIFYVIHPNEDYFYRNQETLEILNKKPDYFNKIIKTFEIDKLTGIVGNNNLLTNYGILVNKTAEFLEYSIDFAKTILDCESFDISLDSEIYKNILLFIVFRTIQLNFQTPNYFVGKSDYLINIGLIDNSLFDKINLNLIYNELDPELKFYDDVIKKNVNNLISNYISSNTPYWNKIMLNNINEIKKLLISFYTIKIKIEIMKKNEKFIKKKEFNNIYNFILNNIENKKNLSNESILNKILIYYNLTNDFLRKNVIIKLNDELKENKSNEFINKLTYKIDRLINSSAIFKNENLILINCESKNKFPDKIITDFNKLSNYDKLCFIIIKNFSQNILTKVPFTEFYINYYDRNINQIYTLEKNIFNPKYTKTKVPHYIRNYLIFRVNDNDNLDLNNIFVLNENVVNILDKYFKLTNINLFKKNINFDYEYCKSIYLEDKYINILKKMDKIIEYIRQ